MVWFKAPCDRFVIKNRTYRMRCLKGMFGKAVGFLGEVETKSLREAKSKAYSSR
jgi:hypothetical protein